MMIYVDRYGFEWRKSSYSGGGNDCVELAFIENGAVLRDSKNPAAGALWLSTAGWKNFLGAVKTGELAP